MALTGENVLYPLAVGNKWAYKMSAGGGYTNSVVGVDGTNPSLFTLHNTSNNINSFMRKDGDIYYTNGFDANVFHPYLKDDFAVGTNWVIQYVANGITTDMTMTVTEAGIFKEVDELLVSLFAHTVRRREYIQEKKNVLCFFSPSYLLYS